MYGMEPYDIVRLADTHESLSYREAARRFGIDPRTEKKMMTFSAPTGYRRRKPVNRHALASLAVVID
jgi:hypothetical protein